MTVQESKRNRKKLLHIQHQQWICCFDFHWAGMSRIGTTYNETWHLKGCDVIRQLLEQWIKLTRHRVPCRHTLLHYLHLLNYDRGLHEVRWFVLCYFLAYWMSRLECNIHCIVIQVLQKLYDIWSYHPYAGEWCFATHHDLISDINLTMGLPSLALVCSDNKVGWCHYRHMQPTLSKSMLTKWKRWSQTSKESHSL